MGEKWRALSFGTREAVLGTGGGQQARWHSGFAQERLRDPTSHRAATWAVLVWGRAGEGEGALCTSRRAVWPTGSRSSPSITLRLAEEISAAGSCDEAFLRQLVLEAVRTKSRSMSCGSGMS